jgi:DNA-binding MarR family transcriptional regulator
MAYMAGVVVTIARLCGRPISENRMSNLSSLAKFSNLLGSVKDSPTSQQPDPQAVILGVLRENNGMIAVSDLRKYTKLGDGVILDAVGSLRSSQLVEIVELPEQDLRRYVRLTPAGYASFAT